MAPGRVNGLTKIWQANVGHSYGRLSELKSPLKLISNTCRLTDLQTSCELPSAHPEAGVRSGTAKSHLLLDRRFRVCSPCKSCTASHSRRCDVHRADSAII